MVLDTQRAKTSRKTHFNCQHHHKAEVSRSKSFNKSGKGRVQGETQAAAAAPRVNNRNKLANARSYITECESWVFAHTRAH
jgi:hypothetical protein